MKPHQDVARSTSEEVSVHPLDNNLSAKSPGSISSNPKVFTLGTLFTAITTIAVILAAVNQYAKWSWLSLLFLPMALIRVRYLGDLQQGTGPPPTFTEKVFNLAISLVISIVISFSLCVGLFYLTLSLGQLADESLKGLTFFIGLAFLYPMRRYGSAPLWLVELDERQRFPSMLECVRQAVMGLSTIFWLQVPPACCLAAVTTVADHKYSSFNFAVALFLVIVSGFAGYMLTRFVPQLAAALASFTMIGVAVYLNIKGTP